jgi:hypothetical protein
MEKVDGEMQAPALDADGPPPRYKCDDCVIKSITRTPEQQKIRDLLMKRIADCQQRGLDYPERT